ncbi:MAG: pyridoxal-phosphate dependent enzyme [Candidatus Nanopelagicales bacterium]
MNPAEVATAAQAVAPAIWEHLPWTPLVEFAAAGEAAGATILVKCEHHQRTGSFKARGALAKVSLLDDPALSRAPTGNHGLGVAYALRACGNAAYRTVARRNSPPWPASATSRS